MFPIRSHQSTDNDYYTFEEMQAMVAAANSRPVTLNGRAGRVSWAGAYVSVLVGAARQQITWTRLARALNGAGAL
jgi:hypothetical protein